MVWRAGRRGKLRRRTRRCANPSRATCSKYWSSVKAGEHRRTGDGSDPWDRHVAALGNDERVPQRVRVAAEDGRHLFRGLQEKLVAGVAQPLRVIHRLPRADAEQDVVRLMVALPQVVHVVGGNERQIELARQRKKTLVDGPLVSMP